MVAVSTVDGIKYGFRLLGYLLAVVVAGGLLLAIGVEFSPGPYGRGNAVLAFVFMLAGMAIIYAGGLGMLYKVIADGVAVGNRAADGGGTVGGLPPGAGGPPANGTPQGGRERAKTREARAQSGHQTAAGAQASQQPPTSRGDHQ